MRSDEIFSVLDSSDIFNKDTTNLGESKDKSRTNRKSKIKDFGFDTVHVRSNQVLIFRDSAVYFEDDTTLIISNKAKYKLKRGDKEGFGYDTVQVNSNQVIIINDSSYHFKKDTILILSVSEKHKIKKYIRKTRIVEGPEYDTIFLINKNVLILNDSVINCTNDSVCVVAKGEKYKIKKNKDYKGTFTNDSTFYDSLHTKSNSHWLTKEMYNALVTYSAQEKVSGTEFVKAEEVYLPFVGKVIGEINFKQVDVVEGNVEDTTLHVHSFFGKISNGSHRNTRGRVLMNYLVIDEGDTLGKYSLSDNERLLRQREFIRDVRIVPLYRTDDTTIVDLIIITQDVYSIGVEGAISSLNKFNINLFDRNLLGWGRALDLDFTIDNTKKPPTRYNFRYLANNLGGTYIDLILNYFSDFRLRQYVTSLGRGFVTPETKYAGGINFIRSEYHVDYPDDEGILEPRTWEQHNIDTWFGRSFLLGSKFDKEGLRKNIRLAGRYSKFRSFERPDVVNDTLNFSFRNRQMILGSVSFSKVNYYKERNILAYGVIEDMPYGIVGELIGGFEDGELGLKPYAGYAWGFGASFKRGGYLSFYTQHGGFLKDQNVKEGVVSTYVRYFTPHITVGKFMFRPIVNFQFVQGLFPKSSARTDFRDAIRGITADQLIGKSATSMKLELNVFAPWNIYGFRVAIVPFLDMLAVTDKADLTMNGRREYAGYGMIIRLRNENLIMKSVQLGVGYYPNPPDGFGNYKFGYSTDIPQLFRLNRSSKPAVFPY